MVPDPLERARLDEALRFRDRVHAHPAYRAYARLRRRARAFVTNGRA